MTHPTEQILQTVINTLSALPEVKSIGMSGSKTPLPQAGEADMDLFIYCDKIPTREQRKNALASMGSLLQDTKTNVFEGGHWGLGDFALINGVETWFMYFTTQDALSDIDSILRGDYPDKLNNYYYPIGRCAMIKSMTLFTDKEGFLSSLKTRLENYPAELSSKLFIYHTDKLEDTEDLKRAVLRKDALFYHFALDLALDHFLQALFARNKIFFPSRKRTLDYLKNFQIKPVNCSERLLEVLHLGGRPETIPQSYDIWADLIIDLKNL